MTQEEGERHPVRRIHLVFLYTAPARVSHFSGVNPGQISHVIYKQGGLRAERKIAVVEEFTTGTGTTALMEDYMISGAHIIIYSTHADADRAFFRDTLGLANVDAGEDWLIFALPPSEVAVHPAANNNVHELYLICEHIDAFIAHTSSLGVETSAVEDQTWGLLTHVTLPGGGKLGVYEPRHERPR